MNRCQAVSSVSAALKAQFATSRQQSTFKYLAAFVAASEEKVKKANTTLQQEGIRYKSFFDIIEKNPLTVAQHVRHV